MGGGVSQKFKFVNAAAGLFRKAPKSNGGQRNFFLTFSKNEKFLNSFQSSGKVVKNIALVIREKVFRQFSPDVCVLEIFVKFQWKIILAKTTIYLVLTTSVDKMG